MLVENQKKLEEIFRIVLEIPNNEDVQKVRRINYPRWDSLAQVSLVVAIESELGVTLSDSDQIDRISSFASATLLLEEVGF